MASNIVGTVSSEPAELIVHGMHLLKKRFSFINKLLILIDDLGWSDWQSFSECKGIPCSIGRQRRIRTCLNPPTITNRPSCDGDQIQERECQVACPKDLPHPSGVILPTGLIDLKNKKCSSYFKIIFFSF